MKRRLNIKRFSDNLNFEPIDFIVECGMNDMSNSECKKLLSKLSSTELDDLKEEIKHWIDIKPERVDELAMKTGAQLINKNFNLTLTGRLHNLSRKLKHLNKSKKVKVEFIDDEGEGTAEFDSMDEAAYWVRAQEARASSGEKFKMIKIERL